jgi:hypothetical protein
VRPSQREQIADLREDRDRWRRIAERLAIAPPGTVAGTPAGARGRAQAVAVALAAIDRVTDMPIPPSEGYAHEKLMLAVHALATGVSPLQKRLADAAQLLIRLQPDDFPEDLRRMFEGVIDDLSFDQAQGDEGRIAATMKITSDEDASAIAGRIFSLFVEMSRRAAG